MNNAALVAFTFLLTISGFTDNQAAAQTVSGCSGSLANIAVGSFASQANALASKALETAWPEVSTKVLTSLARENIAYGACYLLLFPPRCSSCFCSCSETVWF